MLAVTFNVSGASATEGSGVQFTISYSGSLAPMEGASVQYATANGTATTGDYTSTSGTAMFWGGGPTTQVVTVTTNGDTTDEDDETLLLNLSNPFNGSIGTGQATGTILDNDNPPTVSVGDASAAEGGTATFTATLSQASGKTITVSYATQDVTAVAGTDYTNTSGSITFNPGETSKTFTVATTTDSLDEDNETFNVNLSSPSNVTINDGQGVGTVSDDDPLVGIVIGNDSKEEGQTLNFTVTLSTVSGKTVTVQYATSEGTADDPTDYTGASGTLTFTPGQTSKVVNVTTHDDLSDEDSEMMSVTLSNANNGTITRPPQPAARSPTTTIRRRSISATTSSLRARRRRSPCRFPRRAARRSPSPTARPMARPCPRPTTRRQPAR
jgi:chitinase